MVQIVQLASKDTANSADQLPCYDASSGDARKMALSVLLAYIKRNFTTGFIDYLTEYAAPSASGFNISIDAATDNVHLILTPAAGYAAGTITLPAYPGIVDKQEVIVNCTQSVDALTVLGNGATAVTGAPSALSANGFFRLKFDLLSKTWYRLG